MTHENKTMNFISKPFGYLFRYLFEQTNNYLLSVILLALIFHAIIFLIDIKQRRNARILSRITPQINKLKAKYPKVNDDPEQTQKFQLELTKLYKENHYSGLFGCIVPILTILSVLILYNVMTRPLTFLFGLTPELIETLKNYLISQGVEVSAYMQLDILQYLSTCNEGMLYSLLPDISISTMPNMMLGNISLGITPSFEWPLILIPVFACISTFISTLPAKFYNKKQMSMSDMMSKSFDMGMKNNNAEELSPEKTIEIEKLKKIMGKVATWGFQIYTSVLTIIISFKLPVIVAFYWIFRSVFTVIKDIILYKLFPEEKNNSEEVSENNEEQSLSNEDDNIDDETSVETLIIEEELKDKIEEEIIT